MIGGECALDYGALCRLAREISFNRREKLRFKLLRNAFGYVIITSF